jgi:hypothetical protein
MTTVDLTELTPDELEFYRETQKYLKVLEPGYLGEEEFPDSTSSSIATETSLVDSITRVDTTMRVSSYNGFPSTPFKVKIDAEHIYVTKAAGHVWDITRSIDNTDPVTHYAGSRVMVMKRG